MIAAFIGTNTAEEIPGRIRVPCTVTLENTADFMRADVDLGDIAIGPGDQVIVHGGPRGIGFGEAGTFACEATIIRAGWMESLWWRVAGYLELTELYEIGFSAGR